MYSSNMRLQWRRRWELWCTLWTFKFAECLGWFFSSTQSLLGMPDTQFSRYCAKLVAKGESEHGMKFARGFSWRKPRIKEARLDAKLAKLAVLLQFPSLFLPLHCILGGASKLRWHGKITRPLCYVSINFFVVWFTGLLVMYRVYFFRAK